VVLVTMNAGQVASDWASLQQKLGLASRLMSCQTAGSVLDCGARCMPDPNGVVTFLLMPRLFCSLCLDGRVRLVAGALL